MVTDENIQPECRARRKHMTDPRMEDTAGSHWGPATTFLHLEAFGQVKPVTSAVLALSHNT